MRGTQFDHFASTNEQDALTGHRFKNPLGQMHAGGSHRDNVGADGRRAAHLLGNREGALKQLMQLRTQRACLLCRAHRILDLPKNLRLTDHHRVQAAGHPESMADCSGLIVGIEIGQQLLARHLMVGTEPVDHRFRRISRTVDFSTVAGRQNGDFARGVRPR